MRPTGEFHRAGPNRATWPSVLTENPYQRPELGPRLGPTLCDLRSDSLQRLREESHAGHAAKRRQLEAVPPAADPVEAVGFDRIGALHHRSATLYQIPLYNW